ncbi:MAG: type II secretion system protein [Ramlibacter sp.]
MGATSTRSDRGPRAGEAGYTYIGLLLLVAMIGIVLATAGVVWRTEMQREREAQLLFVGEQFAAAITDFYERTPAGQRPRFPARLEELLDDPRWPTTKRHLRRLYVDPFTGEANWGLVPSPEGGILGVYSQAAGTPLRRANFPPRYQEAFETAMTYADWRFVYIAPGSTGN